MADLRTWLDDVDKIGQLMVVDGVDRDLELSTLAEIINERSKNRPALLFDRIKDYAKGYRVAANLVSSVDRLALTLGMTPGLSDLDFIENWRRKVKTAVPTRRSPSILCGAPGAGPSIRASRVMRLAIARARSSTPRAPTSGAISSPR
jgi:3-polyprenyl-4-hydroxybenzoate decarboxylase